MLQPKLNVVAEEVSQDADRYMRSHPLGPGQEQHRSQVEVRFNLLKRLFRLLGREQLIRQVGDEATDTVEALLLI